MKKQGRHRRQIAERIVRYRVPTNGTGRVSEEPERSYKGTFPPDRTWQLYEGDALDRLKLIPDATVNCVVTSPPYFAQRDYGVEGQIGHESTIDGYVQAIVGCFREIKRVLRDDGVVFLNLGDTYYSAKGKPHGKDDKSRGRLWLRKKLRSVDGPGLGLPRKSLIGIPWRTALAMQADGWTLRSDVVWKRPGALPEPTAHDRPWQTHEDVFIFSKKPRYWFNRAAIAGEEDIWHIPPRPDFPGAHFAPFPSALVEKCIQCGCPPGGTVLDPFVGSGTTMAVALRMARHALGIELHPDYCKYIVARLKKASTEQRQAPLALAF
jgi:DNA modification methylase